MTDDDLEGSHPRVMRCTIEDYVQIVRESDDREAENLASFLKARLATLDW